MFGAAAEAWLAAAEELEKALRDRDRATALWGARLLRATGGRSVARFEAVCRRRSYHNVSDAVVAARALRARPRVRALVAERDEALARCDERIAAARARLVEAGAVLDHFGRLGEAIRLRTAELSLRLSSSRTGTAREE